MVIELLIVGKQQERRAVMFVLGSLCHVLLLRHIFFLATCYLLLLQEPHNKEHNNQ